MSQSKISNRHLVAAHMLIQGMPDASIRFFAQVFDTLQTNDQLTCSEMARHYGCTPQAASKHLRVLVSSDYLTRVHYRAWALNRGKVDSLLQGEHA